MPKSYVLIAHVIDENGDVISTQEIDNKEITAPTDVCNFGYNKAEQLNILQITQDNLLQQQAIFLNKSQQKCPTCNSKIWKSGFEPHIFESVYTSHKISMRQWRCSKKGCSWTSRSNLKNQLQGNVHIDLLKIQAEFGAKISYRSASDKLNKTIGERSINNHMQVRKVTNKCGSILSEHQHEKANKTADNTHIKTDNGTPELCVAADGGHVHDSDNPGHNFEVMIGKIYKPVSLKRIDKHHSSITQKHCAGSAKYDIQKTMKENLSIAAKLEGINKNKTTVTGLADGAKNCWSVIKSLAPLCLLLICILDWFHIGKYIERVKKITPSSTKELDLIKNDLWHGKIKPAQLKIKTLLNSLNTEKEKKVINNFYDYIENNKEHLVNYSDRQEKGQIYTSHVAESTVEHLINERCKRKQKMQWSRIGIHAVIQLRASLASNEWDFDWDNIIVPKVITA